MDVAQSVLGCEWPHERLPFLPNQWSPQLRIRDLFYHATGLRTPESPNA
jgi:hypothetical protein